MGPPAAGRNGKKPAGMVGNWSRGNPVCLQCALTVPGLPLVAPARSSVRAQADPSPPPGPATCGNRIQGAVPVSIPCVFHHGQCSPVSVAHGAGRAPGVQERGRMPLEDVQLSGPYPQLWGPPLQDRECSEDPVRRGESWRGGSSDTQAQSFALPATPLSISY